MCIWLQGQLKPEDQAYCPSIGITNRPFAEVARRTFETSKRRRVGRSIVIPSARRMLDSLNLPYIVIMCHLTRVRDALGRNLTFSRPRGYQWTKGGDCASIVLQSCDQCISGVQSGGRHVAENLKKGPSGVTRYSEIVHVGHVMVWWKQSFNSHARTLSLIIKRHPTSSRPPLASQASLRPQPASPVS